MEGDWFEDDPFSVAGSAVLTTDEVRHRSETQNYRPFTAICRPLRVVKQFCPKLFYGCLGDETSFRSKQKKTISRSDLFGLRVLSDIYGYLERYLIPPDAFEEVGYKVVRNMGPAAVGEFAWFVARNNGNPASVCELALNPSINASEAKSLSNDEYLSSWYASLLEAEKMNIIGPLFRLAGLPGVVKVAGNDLCYRLDPNSWNTTMFIPNVDTASLTPFERAIKIVGRYSKLQEGRVHHAGEKRYRCPFFYKVARNQFPGNYRGKENRGDCDNFYTVNGLNQHLGDEHGTAENLFNDCEICGQPWILRGQSSCDVECYLADHAINCFASGRDHFAGWDGRKERSVNFGAGLHQVIPVLSAESRRILRGWKLEYQRSGIKVYGSAKSFFLTFVVD
ncbi:uncharacterized protein LOC129583139 isoform X2 [Paramacrobiotus metropolitanus]|nr:uncharacterized protein LOC129583139 isoform X2 [Paramacrobiotus metropolitanus]XP_055330830.1 uncharacterized protein LOC129583139 isoform X2 [Paramacrobiotus metropolitanus]XP_055330831.1 uncharacterized protein LOC129583139 isoform X2 [Paramacrobiotus metropolitanus]XP_055330832.1 uncharacterized protein LOC129583139 isoform X2 [Paramacrobiotus metropolitanus]